MTEDSSTTGEVVTDVAALTDGQEVWWARQRCRVMANIAGLLLVEWLEGHDEYPASLVTPAGLPAAIHAGHVTLPPEPPRRRMLWEEGTVACDCNFDPWKPDADGLWRLDVPQWRVTVVLGADDLQAKLGPMTPTHYGDRTATIAERIAALREQDPDAELEPDDADLVTDVRDLRQDNEVLWEGVRLTVGRVSGRYVALSTKVKLDSGTLHHAVAKRRIRRAPAEPTPDPAVVTSMDDLRHGEVMLLDGEEVTACHFSDARGWSLLAVDRDGTGQLGRSTTAEVLAAGRVRRVTE